MTKSAQIHLLHSRSATPLDETDRPTVNESHARLGIVPVGYALEGRLASSSSSSLGIRGMRALPYLARPVEPAIAKLHAPFFWGVAVATFAMGVGLTTAYIWWRSTPTIVLTPIAVAATAKAVITPAIVKPEPITMGSSDIPAALPVSIAPPVTEVATPAPAVNSLAPPTSTVSTIPPASLAPIPLPSMATMVPASSTVNPPPTMVASSVPRPVSDAKNQPNATPTATVVATPYNPTVITSTPVAVVSRAAPILIKPAVQPTKPREDASPILRTPAGSAAIPYVTMKRSALGVDALSTTAVVVTDKKTGLPHSYKLGDDIPGIGLLRMIDPATSTLITAQRAIRLED